MSDGDTRPDGHPYDAPHLARAPANHAALTPLGFLERAAAIYPDKLAVIEPAPAKADGTNNGGERRFTYRQFYDRVRRFADALRRRGIGSSFLNFLRDPSRMATAFTPENWTALRRIKAAYDPDNIFRAGLAVPPAAALRERDADEDTVGA